EAASIATLVDEGEGEKQVPRAGIDSEVSCPVICVVAELSYPAQLAGGVQARDERVRQAIGHDALCTELRGALKTSCDDQFVVREDHYVPCVVVALAPEAFSPNMRAIGVQPRDEGVPLPSARDN